MIGIHGLNIDHLDVVTVVLYSEVNHEVIHVMLPTNMQDGFQASVIAVRLKEALYGLKQTQWLCHTIINTSLLYSKFTKSLARPNV